MRVMQLHREQARVMQRFKQLLFSAPHPALFIAALLVVIAE